MAQVEWCIVIYKENEIALGLTIDGIRQDSVWLAVQTKEDAKEWYDKYWQWQTTPCPFLPKEAMLTPHLITRQLTRLIRWQRGLCRDYTVAYLGSDELAMQAIRAEYLLLSDLIRQLRSELFALEGLAEMKAAAVAQVYEWLEIEA